MKTCAGDVMPACPSHQTGRGGSNPTPALTFHAGMTDEATSLVMRYHYSRRWPSNVQFVGTMHAPGGLFGTCGECLAAIVFSIPPTRWSLPVLELSRLVRVESERVPLTRLIRLAVLHVKRRGLDDLLISFADWTQKHHGGVYQAAGWNYDGLREPRMDGVIVDGAFVPGRSANSVWDTQSPRKLAEIGIDADPHFDDGKYLYWKALNAAGEFKALRLGLRKRKYPKPGKNVSTGG